MHRRNLLALAGGTLALAGCGGTSDDNETDDTNTSDDNQTNGSETSDDNGTDTSDSDEGGDETYADESGVVPADIIRQFYEAVETTDVAAVNDLLHSAVAGGANEQNVQDDDWEFVSLDAEVLEEDPSAREYAVREVPDGERTLLVRASAVLRESGSESTQERRFLLATENGEWQLWDLAQGFFHRPQQAITIEGVTGVVGAPGEIHELRVTVRPQAGSAVVDLSRLRIGYTGPERTDLTVDDHDGARATADTDPEHVEPNLFRTDAGKPDDRYGVAVVSAEQPDDLRMTADGDRYELVVATPGGETDERVERLSPLTAGDSVELLVRTHTSHRSQVSVEVPDLDGYDVGAEVEL
jgi:archaellin